MVAVIGTEKENGVTKSQKEKRRKLRRSSPPAWARYAWRDFFPFL